MSPARWLLPGGSVALALASVVAVVATASGGPPPSAAAPRVPAPPADATVVAGTYGLERGPDGRAGQWTNATRVVVRLRRPAAYLTFRATSFRRPRTIRVSGGPATEVPTTARSVVVGPLRRPAMSATLVVRPGPGREASASGRRLGVFVAGLEPSAGPVGASPGRGFWPEVGAAGWLMRAGDIDVAGATGTDRARVRLGVSAPRPTSVTVSAPGGRRAVVRVSGDAVVPVALGPFDLRRARARLSVSCSTPPVRLSRTDGRRACARVRVLDATRAGR